MTAPTVLCLCCGTHYDSAGNCPNLHRLPHSVELAAAVARYLLVMRIDEPTMADIQAARAALQPAGT